MSHVPRTFIWIVPIAAVAVVASLFVSPAPAEDAADLKLPAKVSFNRDIRPIFSNICWECHGPDPNTREADLRLDVRAAAVAVKDEIAAIVPGDPEESEAWLLITADKNDQMPPADFRTQLTARDKALIKKWIEQGAEYQQHWAFIPPQRPAVPKVKQPGTGAIDALVRARLEAEGMKPAGEADKRTLIRRVTLDLTGLPPTPEQVDAFVADRSADAYEKVVDRLLSSKAYAEHMTRHWLDAARYADTSGYQYDRIRNQWVWRDWVIHAFDTNMPFDEFTIHQNAGDLIPNATPLSRLATGFHRNHPITIEGGVIDEEYRTEYVMDRVVTTTTTWMGLTFICARCHDHKYDPVSMDDFYSFYAFFNNVPERGLNGFAPKAKLPSPLAGDRTGEIQAQMAQARKKLDAAMAKAGGSMPQWERKLAADAEAAAALVKPVKVTATGGPTFKPLPDGSVLATGPNPATSTYTIDFVLGKTATKAIRLEALTHDSHVNKSTGRGSNGNFVLSEVTVEAAPARAPDSALKKVKIATASADYQQNGYPISATIDGQHGRGGWAVDGNTRFASSTGTFTLADPIPAGSRVRVKLVHTWGGSHTIGRFRLSTPADGREPVPASVVTALKTEPAKRSPQQKAGLERELIKRYGGAEASRLIGEIERLQRQVSQAAAKVPETMILQELGKPRQAYVLERGEYDKKIQDRPAAPNIPKVFGGLPEGVPRDRLGLARWLVARDNPLTARVTVNRFWAQLFGTGLVKTIEDFGSQGEFPSHPELLDWLAVEFMDSGWDVKHILKTMVTSATYRQDAKLTPQSFAADPHNRLLARGPRFRVDAEVVRDSALAVSGLLDRTLGGPSVYPYHPQGLWIEINNRPGYSRAYPHTSDTEHLYRRSVYTFWKRTVPPPSLEAFDAPGREYCVVSRSKTNTPLQAFVLLHDPQFVEAARHMAARMIASSDEPGARLIYGFKLATAREPSLVELKVLRDTLNERLAQYRSDEGAARQVLSVGASKRDASIDVAEHAAYTSVARMILNLSEFITKG